MPLHTDLRPTDLSQFYGNEALKASILSILARKDRPRSFLFHGPSGCGKTTLAQIYANMIGCHKMDYLEVDIGDARNIDDARRIKREVHIAPFRGSVKVYCLDECHKANDFFQDSMLKILETPPRHVVFILCTTNPEELKNTVRRRCQDYEVELLPGPIVRQFAIDVLTKLGVVPPEGYPLPVLEAIVKYSEGRPGKVLTAIDKIIDMPTYESMAEILLKSIEIHEATIKELCEALYYKRDFVKIIGPILKALIKDGTNYENIRLFILGWATTTLVNTGHPNAALMLDCFKEPWHYTGKSGLALSSFLTVYKPPTKLPEIP